MKVKNLTTAFPGTYLKLKLDGAWHYFEVFAFALRADMTDGYRKERFGVIDKYGGFTLVEANNFGQLMRVEDVPEGER